jgi:hypothetical protein
MKKENISPTFLHAAVIAVALVIVSSCSRINMVDFHDTTPIPLETRRSLSDNTPTPQAIAGQPTAVTSQLDTWCQESLSENPYKIEGNLLLGTSDGVITEDISSFKISPLGIDGGFTKFSFDGDWVADYSDNGITDVLLINQNQNVKIIPPGNSSLYGFLENGGLLFGADSNYRNNNKTAEFTTISPNGEIITKSISLPEYHEEDIAFVPYSPNFKYIMYPQKKSDKNTTAIINTESGELKIVDSKWLIASTKFGPFPTWMPNNIAVTVLLVNRKQMDGPRNFYNISPDGQVNQLTYLENFIHKGYNLFYTPVWSPNSRYLIIPISLNENKSKTLFVLDHETGKVLDTCVEWSQALYLPLAWSPSSKYFAIQPEKGNKILIVNIENGAVYNLVLKDIPNVNLLGWVNWENR